MSFIINIDCDICNVKPFGGSLSRYRHFGCWSRLLLLLFFRSCIFRHFPLFAICSCSRAFDVYKIVAPLFSPKLLVFTCCMCVKIDCVRECDWVGWGLLRFFCVACVFVSGL